MNRVCHIHLSVLLILVVLGTSYGNDKKSQAWKIGEPIVTYWAGPGFYSTPMTDAGAQQLADGGWNVVWCHANELDVVGKHGLRAQLNDPLLTPATLDNPEKLEALDALIERVRKHPALYNYFIGDEPGAKNFRDIGRLVEYLRKKDPAHPAYINLFPTGATNEQLGTKGDTVVAYNKYLNQFVETVRPSLLSYDHYQFAVDHDTDDYFLNISLMRQAAQNAGLPFLNIVQACTWRPSMRVPVEGEMRYLVYTSLAYGAQGISYYVYSHPGHRPGIATADGKPTAIYHWLKPLNRNFLKIAREVQSLQSLGVYHAGMMPPGAKPLPDNSAFHFDPPIPTIEFQPGKRVQGALIGMFGPTANGKPTHAIVVNLDYKQEQVLNLKGTVSLEQFDPATGKWISTTDVPLKLRLLPGEGVLVRCR